MLSKGYHTLIRFIFKSKIYDHQGGMKGMDRETIMKIVPLIQDTNWFWDTELLVISQWSGLKILEIPIKSQYAINSSTVNWMDILHMSGSAMSLLKRKNVIKNKLKTTKHYK